MNLIAHMPYENTPTNHLILLIVISLDWKRILILLFMSL